MRALLVICLLAVSSTAMAAPRDPVVQRDLVAAQCDRILDAFWRAVQPALPRLRLRGDAALEQRYKQSLAADLLRGKCRDFSDATRRCLEHAPDPLAAIQRCGADPFTVRPVDVTALSDVALPPKLSVEAQAAQLAQLLGTWRDSRSHLTIDADGRVHTNFAVEMPDDSRLNLETAGVIVLRTAPQMLDLWTFVLEDSATLRLCVNNTFYGHGVRVGDDQSFVARVHDDVLFFDRGRCTVVTRYGEVVPATCAVVEREQQRRLRFSYPRAYWPIVDAERILLPGRFVDPACPLLRRR